ncbi:gamma conglutin 1-like [Rutidosis leptorrhynchoides]|uniref:gamma conglutin 1-like n=1 Tax=Rutidosis leptorrhynchoides TaxID=125765 RepID=UPI003A9A0614
MLSVIKLIAIILAFISPKSKAETINEPKWSSLVLPVIKHTDDNIAKPYYYSTHIHLNHSLYNQQDLLIDLDAPFIWHAVNIINPVTGLCIKQDKIWPVAGEQFMMTKSNGRNILSYDNYSTYPTTATVWPTEIGSFPKDVLGVLALLSSLYALPAYLFDPIKQIVSLCLPTSVSTSGVLFFGTGPYYLSPKSNVDITSLLSYTPLIKHPDSFGYFIGVESFVIKNRSIKLSVNTTAKISTLDTYTTLRTDIYNSVHQRFTKVTKRIAPAKIVAPFGLRFNTSSGVIKVPNIDLILQNGKKWSITTSNSVKQVTNEVACLAFIDGGDTSEHAIVIGTHQFEDNFVSFNLEDSTFGLSSSLLPKNISCSNFSF